MESDTFDNSIMFMLVYFMKNSNSYHAVNFTISVCGCPDEGMRPGRLDVTSLLVGLISAGVSVVVIGLLSWYFCHGRCKEGLSRTRYPSTIYIRSSKSDASIRYFIYIKGG